MKASNVLATSRFHGIAVVAVLTTVPTSVQAQAPDAPETSACTQIGTLAELRRPDPGLKPEAWRRASAFMQGTMFGLMAPTQLEPLGAGDGRMQRTLRNFTDSTCVCFEARIIGSVADVAFIQFRGDVLLDPGPLEMHELFAAIAPDGRLYLLGQDSVLEAVGRNNPAVARVSTILRTYDLAHKGPSSEQERREVAQLLTGASSGDGMDYQYCKVGPQTVRAIVGTAYDTVATDIDFAYEGGIQAVYQRQAALTECTAQGSGVDRQ